MSQSAKKKNLKIAGIANVNVKVHLATNKNELLL